MLDFLDYALGPIKSVQGFAANQAGLYPAEDIVSGSFVFESGVLGTGTWCFTAHDKLDRTEIIGTSGTIQYATFGETPIILRTTNGTQEFTISNPTHIQQPLIEIIVRTLNGQGDCPSTGETGARTSWVMDQMINTYYGRA